MDLNEYQRLARLTAIYPNSAAVIYPAMGAAGEAGEIANKAKRILRDTNGVITPELRAKILEEVGDNLWYLANVCHDLESTLGDVARDNLIKLNDRKERGVLKGEGDTR